MDVEGAGSRFADRLAQACDERPDAPARRGRLTWLARELEAEFGTTVSIETVRKWFEGISMPRPEKMKQVAHLLEVDVAWLSLGVLADVQQPQEAGRSVPEMNVAKVVAAFIQLQGGAVAVQQPSTADVDFFVIVNGVHLSCIVRLGREDSGGSVTFDTPPRHAGSAVLLVLLREGFAVDVFHLPNAILERLCDTSGRPTQLHGRRDGAGLTVSGSRLDPLLDVHNLVRFAVGTSVGIQPF